MPDKDRNTENEPRRKGEQSPGKSRETDRPGKDDNYKGEGHRPEEKERRNPQQ